jgi:CRP-like cAMP-binding protein
LLSCVKGDCLTVVRQLLNRLEAFAFRSIRERLAFVLIDTVRREQKWGNPPDGLPSAPILRLTQQDLAGLVGGTRESISRKLQELEQEGAIALSRGRVTIRDWEKLQQVELLGLLPNPCK